jgi:hypothetical protein
MESISISSNKFFSMYRVVKPFNPSLETLQSSNSSSIISNLKNFFQLLQQSQISNIAIGMVRVRRKYAFNSPEYVFLSGPKRSLTTEIASLSSSVALGNHARRTTAAAASLPGARSPCPRAPPLGPMNRDNCFLHLRPTAACSL